MDLEKARHLVALADHGTFNRAATAVNLTQPAFSRSIRALERELGVQLVDRGARASRLTPYGEVVVQRARILLRGVRDAQRDLQLLKTGEVGRLAVGLDSNAAATLLEPWLHDLVKRDSALQVRIEVGETTRLAQHLRDEELDVVLGEGRTLLGDPDLEAELLHTARLCFAVRPGHPLLAHAPVTTEMLTRYPMGSATLTPALAYAFEEATGHASGENPSHLVVRTDRHDVLRALAMHTDLVLGGTTRVLRDDLATGALVDLAVHGIDFDYRLALASLAGRTLPAAATRLRDVARSQFT